MKKIILTSILIVLSINIHAQITTYPYLEDFESGDGGWTVDDPANVSWELGTPANTIINSADSGANAWVTSLTGDYASNENGAVVSPVFDFSSLAAPSIEFSIWWNSEFSWDGMVLQSSIDGGTSWQNVGDFGDPNNWFNDDTIAGNPGGQSVGWTGRDVSANGSGGWVTARHALVGLAGQGNVLLRFAFGSDGIIEDEGIGFDTINIFEVSCPEPSGVSLSGVIATSAEVSWTAGGGETMWEIAVQTAGTGVPAGSGTSIMTNPYTAIGLTANTEYEVFIRSDCSGEFSSWVGPINFITPCGAIVPEYNADMSVNVPDACWDESNDGEIADGPSGSGTSDWRDGTDYAFGDSNAINLFGNSDREWLLSPFFDLSAGGYQLEVNVAVTNWLNGFEDDTMGSDDEVRLLQSLDGGATWTTLTTWNAANEPAVGGTEYIEDLSGVTGTNVQFAIWASDGTINDAEDYDFHVGKFRVRTPPACPDPLNLTLDTFSDVTAVVSWTPGAMQTSWEVAVQPAGTGIPSGPGDTTIDNPYTITGLTATTQYEVWVRGDCGADGFSSWLGPLTFTTLNTPPPPPNGVVCGSGSSSFIFTAEFDGVDGWTGDLNGGDGTWEIPNDSGSGGTGADTAFSGASFMNYEASGNATATASAVSPGVDLTTAVDGAELSFYMHAFGADMGTLNVGVGTDPSGPFTTEFAWAGDLQTAGSDPWVPIGVNLDAYLGQVIYIEFSHTGSGTGFEGDMSIDLVRVETCGSFCIAPSSIATSGVTDNSADIDWVGNSGESAWEYVVVPVGTGEPTGPGTPTATPSVNVTGLTGATEYEVWVRADCGGGTFSLWAGPVTFITLNTPPPPPNGVACSSGSSSFIFTAEFDGIDGWTGDLNGGDGTWEIPNDSGSGGTGPDTAFSGASFMNYEASGDATDTASAVSPAIDLTTAVDAAELSFYMHAFGADMGTLNVGVGTDPSGPFTTEFTWIGDLQTSGSEIWVPIGVNLDAYLGQVIYVEFSHTGSGTGFEGDMSIDLVRVETCGSFCIAPSSITTSNATQTTVDIDWVANSGETAWEYVVVPLGTGEPTGPGTPTATPSVNVTGLMGSTQYEIWVRADCGGGFFSLWAGPTTFFTAPENNDPCSATSAVVNLDDSCTLVTPGTLFQATASGVPIGTCAGDPDDDVWFEFVAESNIQIISILNIDGEGFFQNIDHAVYEGDCASPVELYCSEDEASVTPALTVGNTYYIRIFSANSDAVDYTFDLCIRPGSGNVLVDQTTYTVQQLVEDILIDSPCAQISNITFSTGTNFGEENGIGYFSNPDGGFPFQDGILLTSGDAAEAAGPNTNAMGSGTPGWPGDPDLTTIVTQAGVNDNTNNATIIQFDFVPLDDELSFDFIMASEEYDMGTFECTFSDVFAFLLTDSNGNTTNLAVVPGTTDPILVTNIHPDNGSCPAVNEEFFGEYIPENLPPISFDGRTTVFTAFSSVNIGETYTIKLAIADAGDSNFDSGVFLKAGSFDIGEVDLGGDITIAGGNAVCEDQPITLDTSAPNVDHVWYKDGFVIDGETASTLNVTEAGLYTVQIIFSPSCIIDDEILIEFLPNPVIANPADDLSACSTTNQALFDINVNTSVILGAQSPANYTVTYHESQTNADSDINSLNSPYTNTSNPQTIFVRVEDNTTGCFETTSFELSISSPTHTATSVDLIGCDNDDDGIATFNLSDQDSVVLNGQDASQFMVSYHNSQADADAGTGALSSPYDSSGETIYVRVETVAFADCYVTNSFDLVIGTEPLSSFTDDFDYEVCPNATVPITIEATPENYSENEVSINWYLDNGLIPNENGLTLSVLDAGDYTIEVIFNDTGCSNDATITVVELETCVIPQGISPNNDGLNDTFDLSSYGVTKLEIYNRNGTLVYSKTNYTDEWHGQSEDGEELPVGTYFYTMDYQDGKQRSAWIYIQREN